jgi:aldehyde dehydrogenase (NAD+)
LTETSYVISELKDTSGKAKPKGFSIATQFSTYKDPWKGINYCSMELSISIGAVSLVSAVAGNQVVLKPSELTGNTSAII